MKRRATPDELVAVELLVYLYEASPLPWTASVAARKWGVQTRYGVRRGEAALNQLGVWGLAWRDHRNAPWRFADRAAARRFADARWGYRPKRL